MEHHAVTIKNGDLGNVCVPVFLNTGRGSQESYMHHIINHSLLWLVGQLMTLIFSSLLINTMNMYYFLKYVLKKNKLENQN